MGQLVDLECLSTVARSQVKNLIIVAFDNGCYESNGGILTNTSFGLELSKVASASGLESVHTVSNIKDASKVFRMAMAKKVSSFIDAKIEAYSVDVDQNVRFGSLSTQLFTNYIERVRGRKNLADGVSVMRCS